MRVIRRFKPQQASEKILARDPNHGYVGCRFSADWAATAGATVGESVLSQTARLKSRWARKQDLERAWDAVGRGRLGYNQSHVPTIHRAMFPGLPQPTPVVTEQFSEDLWSHLGQKPDGPNRGDHYISVALDLSVLPAGDPLRQHTGPVTHQVVLAYRNKANDGAYVLDGMAPYSGGDKGYWASRKSIAKAAKAIEEGLIVCELYPVAGWTAEALKASPNLAEVDRLRAKMQGLRASMQAMEDGYEGQLTEVREALQVAEDALASERDDAIDEAIAALQQLK